MALFATNRFAGDGATTSYEFNFVGKYIARPHVKVYQEDNATKVRTPVAITDSNFLNDTTLRNLPVTPAGKTLVIYRDTPKPPMVDFTNGSRFTEYNLDLVARQGLFVAMEAMDEGDIDAREQLLDAIAVVVGLVDDATAAVSDATAAALAAATSAATAQDAATLATSAKTAAAISNTPAGSIAATTVQAALNELDLEKVAKTDVIAIAKGGTGATSANAAADAIGAFRRGTLLGTVSQSAGVPTGAVIERGSNVNGAYVRFADGTQICLYQFTGGLSMSSYPSGLFIGSFTWTFPVTFASADMAITAGGGDSGSAGWGCLGSATSSSGVVNWFSATSNVIATNIKVCAIGRWF